ncbi:MAG: DEAD/DEAH box helicase [Planctomycetes bacterium]|nr:DEAD/DEAH box helicase [Planctomycetota bacterium]
MRFEDLGLVPSLLAAVRSEGYSLPTPIQAEAIPRALAGDDLVACAQTGTGKTAAFALPILQRLAAAERARERGTLRCLVLAPTRELALQVGESFEVYGRGTGLSVAVVHGGVSQRPQVRALAEGVDVLVATPGRLLDLLGQGLARLDSVKILVLDEVDRMLDMGFLPDVRRILGRLTRNRQTLLFSATIPEEIRRLAEQFLRDPVQVRVAPVTPASRLIDQSVHFVERPEKPDLLVRVLEGPDARRVLVFTRTKRGADRVVKLLGRSRIRAQAIHGNKSQGARGRSLEDFRRGDLRVLVATDLAARGLDVDGISHIVNYDLPHEPEMYIHRIGRTGRAETTGAALSFCDSTERPLLAAIERLTRHPLRVIGAPTPRVASGGTPARNTIPAARFRDGGRGSRPRGRRLARQR